MTSEAPPFWWQQSDWRALALAPASYLYGRVAARRLTPTKRYAAKVPVICVGNLTVGGAGKTPVAIALAQAAREEGWTPGFLSRGYKGAVRQAQIVDPQHHDAKLVGDEPILLAHTAPTVVAPRRAAGAAVLTGCGVDLIIMDDGFQSAQMIFDYALLVIDRRRGLGNGHLIPGGPVRAPVGAQLQLADGLLAIGSGTAADKTVRQASRSGIPVFEARLRVVDPEHFKGGRFLAYSGIGDPDKFFTSLAQAGGQIAQTRVFPDHHLFDEEQATELLQLADKEKATLVTTAKDAVRIAGAHGVVKELHDKSHVLNVELEMEHPRVARRILDQARLSFKKRSADLPRSGS